MNDEADGEEIPLKDLDDPEVQKQVEAAKHGPNQLPKRVRDEVMRMIAGRVMNSTRAQAVKRIVRRITQLMGKDAPSPKILKWWTAEMLANLDTNSGIVKLGILRTIAEGIGLIKPGVGLMTKEKPAATFVPTVRFTPSAKNTAAQPVLPKIEITIAQEDKYTAPVAQAKVIECPTNPSSSQTVS